MSGSRRSRLQVPSACSRSYRTTGQQVRTQTLGTGRSGSHFALEEQTYRMVVVGDEWNESQLMTCRETETLVKRRRSRIDVTLSLCVDVRLQFPWIITVLISIVDTQDHSSFISKLRGFLIQSQQTILNVKLRLYIVSTLLILCQPSGSNRIHSLALCVQFVFVILIAFHKPGNRVICTQGIAISILIINGSVRHLHIGHFQ